MRKVLVYRTDILPISETFILAQTIGLKSFNTRLIGLCRPVKSLEVPADTILLTRDQSVRSRLRKRLYWMTGIAPRFHREAANVGAQLIHAHFGPDAVTALHLAEILGLPLIVTLHGYDVTTPRSSVHFYEKLWSRVSLFLCVSNFLRLKAIELGFPPEKLRVHYIGVDRSKFEPSQLDRISESVLFVGRLVEKKGCEYLLRAMAIVQRSLPNARLTVIGDGILREPLEALAKTLRVNCQFLGSQPSEVIRKALGATRVFCAPSVTAKDGDSEGLGIVFAEAQAMGVPVVSSDHGGIPEVVRHGITGLLVPERDFEELAKAILVYHRDDVAWRNARDKGIAWIEMQFDLATQNEELEAIYREVIEQFGDRGRKSAANTAMAF
jgi:colanic acid/amylovoran biosynthesis glycosyltransferase